jgi:DNA-binding transcriptional LysR family regulator
LPFLTEAKRAVMDSDEPSGPLAIGSLETTASLRLPPLIASFGSRFPRVKLSLRVGTNATLIEQVLDHELDGFRDFSFSRHDPTHRALGR